MLTHLSNYFPSQPNQISMSVLLNPVHVTTTLIVPTVTVLTAVLANRDLLEMEQLAKVTTFVQKKYHN